MINLLQSTVCGLLITSSYHASGCIMVDRDFNVADQLCWKCAWVLYSIQCNQLKDFQCLDYTILRVKASLDLLVKDQYVYCHVGQDCTCVLCLNYVLMLYHWIRQVCSRSHSIDMHAQTSTQKN